MVAVDRQGATVWYGPGLGGRATGAGRASAAEDSDERDRPGPADITSNKDTEVTCPRSKDGHGSHVPL
jgi:hypothetical protein